MPTPPCSLSISLGEGDRRAAGATGCVPGDAPLPPLLQILHRIRRRVERDPSPYSDPALEAIESGVVPLRSKEKALKAAAAA